MTRPPPPARERRGARHPAAARPPASTRSSGRPGHGVGHRQRTLDPDTMLMSSPEITCPFTRPGERAIFRVGASKVPSTIALQHPVPPPPPEKATCPPVPMMLEHRVGLHAPGHADLAAAAQ